MGKSGFNSRNYLSFMEFYQQEFLDLSKKVVDYVILCLGINDSTIIDAKSVPVTCVVGLTEYSDNMSLMIDMIKMIFTDAHLLIVAPSPTEDSHLGTEILT